MLVIAGDRVALRADLESQLPASASRVEVKLRGADFQFWRQAQSKGIERDKDVFTGEQEPIVHRRVENRDGSQLNAAEAEG